MNKEKEINSLFLYFLNSTIKSIFMKQINKTEKGTIFRKDFLKSL